MRDGFHEIVSGWMVMDDFDDLTDRIERASEWTKANGPLEPDEAATIKFMIEAQVARGIFRGDFRPVHPRRRPGAGATDRAWRAAGQLPRLRQPGKVFARLSVETAVSRRYPLVSLPDPRLVRPFEVGSLHYWEIVAKVMNLAGASREDAEAFVQRQRCCVSDQGCDNG